MEESIKLYFLTTEKEYLVDQYYDDVLLLVGSWKNEKEYKIVKMTKDEFIILLTGECK